jgi:hypothetical protein
MRRNWLIAAVVIGIAAIVIAAVVMRVTEEERLTTEEWADEVCTSLVDWRTSITSLADVGGEPLTADTLRDRLSDAEDATSDLVQNLRDLGPPDLEAGDELESELDDATAELESSFDALKESADEAADAPASEFLGELADLASDFAALQAAIAETVTTLQDADVAEESKAELQQAFADSSSCQELQAGDS